MIDSTRYVRCTLREIQVLDHFLRDGADNETIGRRMKPDPLSIETIKTHMRRIYARCGIFNRVALALAIIRREVVIIDPDGRVVEFR